MRGPRFAPGSTARGVPSSCRESDATALRPRLSTDVTRDALFGAPSESACWSDVRSSQSELRERMSNACDILVHRAQSILQPAVMNLGKRRIEREPLVLVVLLLIERDCGRLGLSFRGEYTYDLDFIEASVVDRIRVLGGPDGLRRQPVWSE